MASSNTTRGLTPGTHSPAAARSQPSISSDRTAADQPDGRRDEQHRQREQPAALDPLERPEPADRLVAGPLRVALPDETLRNGFPRLLVRPRRRAQPHEQIVGGPAEREP